MQAARAGKSASSRIVEVVRRVHYTDWHRVERAVLMMSLEVSELEDNGWLESSAKLSTPVAVLPSALTSTNL